MLDSEQRFYLARHLLSGVEGLEDLVLTEDRESIREDALARLEGGAVSEEGKILGRAALDIFDLSGGTFLGEAISSLSDENFTRLANAIKALKP